MKSANQDPLFAATGVFSFAQWQISNGPYGGNVTRIIRHGQYLLAGTSNAGVYVSSDDGYSWIKANNGIVCKEISGPDYTIIKKVLVL